MLGRLKEQFVKETITHAHRLISRSRALACDSLPPTRDSLSVAEASRDHDTIVYTRARSLIAACSYCYAFSFFFLKTDSDSFWFVSEKSERFPERL